MPLKKNTPMSTYIKDFEKSDAPQFKGKSKDKRRQMAIAAKLQATGKKKMEETEKEDPKKEYTDLMSKIKASFKHQATKGKEGAPMHKGQTLTPNTKIKDTEETSVSETKGTLCGRCGHVHVKGTPCPRPFKEGSMTSKYDDAPELKGKQTKLPDDLQKSIIDKVKQKLKEIDVDRTRGTVVLPKTTQPADLKKLTDQGLDIELKEATDFFEDTLDDDRYVDVSGPSVENGILELIEDFEDRLKAIPEEGRKKALNAIKQYWIDYIIEWNPNLIVPNRATVTESQTVLKENHQYDYEGKMAKAQLISLIKNAKSLYDSIDDRTQLKSWVQSKLTKAEDYIDGVRTYLDGEAVSSTSPLMHDGEAIHDIEGTMLKIGDVVKGADGRIYQAAHSYSDNKPFLTPFDLKNRKPTNLRERHYFDTVNEGEMSPTNKMIKIMDHNATRGGFVR